MSLRKLAIQALNLIQVNNRFGLISRIIQRLKDDGSADASILSSGQVALAFGGTHADLSGTGGTSQVLKQVAKGADVTVAQLASADLSDVASIPVITPVLGDTIYANSTPAWTKLAGNTTATAKFFQQTGTGAVSAAPLWFDLFGSLNVFTVNQAITGSSNAALVETITNSSNGAAANAQFAAINDTGVNASVRSHSSTRVTTRYGTALASIVELLASGSSLGLMLGSIDNVPTIFGNNSIESGRWNADNSFQVTGNNGTKLKFTRYTELLTLSTSGTTTDTSALLLPGPALIIAVSNIVTTTISGGGVASYTVGDASASARFAPVNANLTSGNAQTGVQQWQGSVAADTSGPVQLAASKVRVTASATPTQGAVRIVVWALEITSPTS